MPPRDGTMLLEAENLTRRYGDGDATVTAQRNTSFQVADGEFVAVMGPSGSGKSTLMNLIGCWTTLLAAR